MEKLTINKQSLGKRGTTAIHLDIDTYLKVEKISILTGRRKTEIIAEMVNFALKHTSVEDFGDVDFDFNLDVKPSLNKPKTTSSRECQKVFVPVKEAIEITGLSEYYFRKHLETGEIPAIRSGNKWLIHIENLLEMLQQQL